MFRNQSSTCNHEEELKKLKQAKEALEKQIKDLEHEEKLKLREKDFELKHFKDETIKKLEKEKQDLQQEVAVLKKENEMLDKIVDLNADIVDVKDLIGKLINKLPEINLQNLTLMNNGSDR